MGVATKPTLTRGRALTLYWPTVDAYPMDSREACAFMGISYPTLKNGLIPAGCPAREKIRLSPNRRGSLPVQIALQPSTTKCTIRRKA